MTSDAVPSARPAGPMTWLARWGGFFLTPAGVAVLVLALTLLRLFFSAATPPTEDEAYYRLWGLHPAWGYLDHPPMVGWWMTAGIALVGDNALGLRLFSVLSVAIGSLALWRTARILFESERAAAWSVLVLNATVFIGGAGIVATPDQPSALFWGLAVWALAELVRSGRPSWWLVAGAFAGLGLVSKYSVLFLGAGMVLWILAWRENRRWLAAWQLWAGGLLAGLIFLPVVLWNAHHGWASFIKQFGRAEAGSLELEHVPEFIAGEVLLIGPLLVPYVLLGAWLAVRAGWKGDVRRGLLVATSLPFALYLVSHGFHDRVQANWAAPLFAASALVAGDAAAWLAGGGRGRLCRWLSLLLPWAVVAGLATGIGVMAHGARPIAGIVSPLDPTQQLRGWKDLAAEVEKQRVAAGARWIATQNYAMTGELSYYLRQVPVEQLHERLRYAAAPDPDPAILQQPGLFVGLERNFYPQYLDLRFRDVKPLGVIERRAGGILLDRYVVIRVADPIGNPLHHAAPW